MPDKNGIQQLEIKKRVSLLERNLLTALQNINTLTLEVEKMRNQLASSGLAEATPTPAAAKTPAPTTAESQPAESARRGPSTVSASQGRTLKVINN